MKIKFPVPVHAREKLLGLIIVAEMTSNFRQEIRYSYYRNDPVKYDLNFTTFSQMYPMVCIEKTVLGFQEAKRYKKSQARRYQ